jgi:tRNA(fMet)-specific endonuclease VapC
MGFTHLLDTNVISRLIREPMGKSAQRLARVGDDRICTSVVVASELRFGAALRASVRLTDAVEQVLAAVPVLAMDQPVDEHYADIRSQLQRDGTPIGPNDLLIAAHARALGLTIVTENEDRVADLLVENWQT